MSYMKRWLEDCSTELGFDGEITDEVMEQASAERCPRAWARAMERAPRPWAAAEAGYLAERLHQFATLVRELREVQELCRCNENRFDERRNLEDEVDSQLRKLL